MSNDAIIDIITTRTADDPISQAELADVLGVRDTRSVRLAVQRLRRAGVPVISSTSPTRGGYFFTDDGEEVRRFLETMKRRALGTLKTIRGMRRSVFDAQMLLPLDVSES